MSPLVSPDPPKVECTVYLSLPEGTDVNVTVSMPTAEPESTVSEQEAVVEAALAMFRGRFDQFKSFLDDTPDLLVDDVPVGSVPKIAG